MLKLICNFFILRTYAFVRPPRMQTHAFAFALLISYDQVIIWSCLRLVLYFGNLVDWKHSYKKKIRTYVENEAILEPLPLYHAWKYFSMNKSNSRAARTVYGPMFLLFYVISVFFFFLSRCKQNRIKLCYNRLQFVKETQISTV